MAGEREHLEEHISHLVMHAGELATLCDPEVVDSQAATITMSSTARDVRLTATEFSCGLDFDPILLCSRRLEDLAAQIDDSFEPTFGDLRDEAGPLTWRGLQLAEAEHRAQWGLCLERFPLRERLRNHMLRLVILTGRLATIFYVSMDLEGRLEPTLADLLLLGVMLSTEAQEDLPEVAIPTTSAELEAALLREEM